MSVSDIVKVKYNGSVIHVAGASSTFTMNTSSRRLIGDIVVEVASVSGTGSLISKSIVSNGVYTAASEGADGYSVVTVSLPPATLISKSITANGTYSASDESADGYSVVTVSLPSFAGPYSFAPSTTVQTFATAGLLMQSNVTIASYTPGTDTTDATLSSGAQMLSGITAYASGVKYTGTIEEYAGMVNSSHDNIPYYSGSVNGGAPDVPTYSGTYYATPSNTEQTFPTAGLLMSSDFTVASVASGGIIPTGTISITENGIYDISQYASANVSVPSGITPTGTLSINANGIYTVTDYASVDVSVPGVVPVGTKVITSNGNYDVSSFASATVNVTSNNDAFKSMVEGTLTAATGSTVSTIRSNAFAGAQTLTLVSFPSCTNVGAGAFYDCTQLVSVYLPSCISVSTQAFEGCSALSDVELQSCRTIDRYAFMECSNLSTLTIDGRYIWDSAFHLCKKLQSLYLTYDSCGTLYASNAFKSTPITDSSYTGTFGSIYVPASLLASYKAANNWSYFSDRFVGV